MKNSTPHSKCRPSEIFKSYVVPHRSFYWFLCLRHQGASALMELPVPLLERSRDHLVRGTSRAWRCSLFANTPNAKQGAGFVDIFNISNALINIENFLNILRNEDVH